MMRIRAIVVAVAVLVSMAGPVLAEDEVPVAAQRIEVPEASVAVALPAEWSVDIEMRQREDWGFVVEDEDEPLAYWDVLYASDGGRPWCDLTWYPEHPMSLDEHGLLARDLMTPTHTDVERTVELSTAMLPIGEAQRLVIYNEPTDGWTTTYLLDLGAGRYLLRCASDERADDDWLGLAETLEAPTTTPRNSPEPED